MEKGLACLFEGENVSDHWPDTRRGDEATEILGGDGAADTRGRDRAVERPMAADFYSQVYATLVSPPLATMRPQAVY
jgi:hypothetical protein